MKLVKRVDFKDIPKGKISAIKVFTDVLDESVVLYLMKEDGLHDTLSIPVDSVKELAQAMLSTINATNKVVVEIIGGCLQSVLAQEPVEVHVVDWDNISQGGGAEIGQEKVELVPDGKFHLSPHFTGDEGMYPEIRDALKEI